MFTTGSKLFLGIGALALAAALVYAVGSDFAVAGTVLLGTAGLGALFMGGVLLALRDADPVAQAAVAGVSDAEAMGMGGTPVAASPWPFLSAFAVALMAVGLVVDRRLFVAGILALVAVILEWMVQAWADRASADPEHNAQVRDQLMQPLEFPVVAVIIALAVVFAFSRVMLSVSSDAGWIIFTAVAVVIMLAGVVLTTRPRISSNTMAAIALVAGVAVITAGIVGAAVGERDIEPHEHSEGVQSVDNQSGPRARITYKGGDGFDLETFVLPKALWTTITFVNDTDEVHGLVVEVGTDADGNIETVHSAERGGPSEQAMTFRILQPGNYRYYLDGDEEVAGTIVVPGVVPPSTTTTTTASTTTTTKA